MLVNMPVLSMGYCASGTLYKQEKIIWVKRYGNLLILKNINSQSYSPEINARKVPNNSPRSRDKN